MLERLKSLLAGEDAPSSTDEATVHLAAAALLVEAALMDGHMDTAEHRRINRLLSARFSLAEADAAALAAEAQRAVEEATQILPFTRVIKDRFTPEQRIEMIEMLWEVVYADGQLHDYESNLVRRIAGLIFVSDQEAGKARKRAMVRLGLSDGLIA